MSTYSYFVMTVLYLLFTEITKISCHRLALSLPKGKTSYTEGLRNGQRGRKTSEINETDQFLIGASDTNSGALTPILSSICFRRRLCQLISLSKYVMMVSSFLLTGLRACL